MRMTRFLLAILLAFNLTSAAFADVRDLQQRGLAARLRGDNFGAIYYFTQAIDVGNLRPSDLAMVLVSRGVAYDNIGEMDKAIADFSIAIELKPQFWDAYIDRGLSFAKKGQYDLAIGDFTDASQGGENAYLALNNRGNVYALKGEHDR